MTAVHTGRQEIRHHNVQMEDRKHASITGVTDVCSFHETEIILRVDSGTMVITGEELHIGKLLLEDGKLDVEGHIDGMLYEKPRMVTRRFRFWKKDSQ